ncbi:hypothetical protein CIW48_06030 [Methylobacterium sp. P1-11]|uniref:ATP-binding protein n=1 Tax=Methylobacterium sp. P1-11 TaxID=2024616 RepID=UPI0011EF3960|nr:hypothetical protein CIW48_06030 [Methylobacterium sp. P1-11]
MNPIETAIAARTMGCHPLARRDADPIARTVGALGRTAEPAVRAGRIIRRLHEFVTRGETERRHESGARSIEEASALALVDARERGTVARLVVNREGGSILADRAQVQQVPVKLIRNAREPMQPGDRREMTVEAEPVELEAVEIPVSERGPGIADAVADRLFQPFVATKPNGMGRGLSIFRIIVEVHGARLRGERNGAGGVTFRLPVPAAHDGDASHVH